MSDLHSFLAKQHCGAPLDLSKVKNGTVRCEFCQNVVNLPKEATSPAALSFLRQGEHDLDTGKFDDAHMAYKKAADLAESEPEAYWGMALAEFKVQYLKDTVNNRLQPICCEITDNFFTKNKNYLKALSLATAEQRAVYANKGKEIDDIRKEFFRLKQSGVDYDCFICVKVSIGKDEKTEDCRAADNIYDLLLNKGYTPFFSERILKKKTGADYEAMILYALYTSETMLVVCRNEEYLYTDWVKNEYSRFLKLVNDEEKESDSITIIYYENPIEKLPGKNGRIQGIDFSRFDAAEQILSFVDEHTPKARERRKAEKEAKLRENKEQSQRLEQIELLQAQQEMAFAEQQRKFAEQQMQQQKSFEEQQRQMQKQLEKYQKAESSRNLSEAEILEKAQLIRYKQELQAKQEAERIAWDRAEQERKILEAQRKAQRKAQWSVMMASVKNKIISTVIALLCVIIGSSIGAGIGAGLSDILVIVSDISPILALVLWIAAIVRFIRSIIKIWKSPGDRILIKVALRNLVIPIFCGIFGVI